MTRSVSIILHCQPKPDLLKQVQHLGKSLGLQVKLVEDSTKIPGLIAKEPPLALLLDTTLPKADEVCDAVRGAMVPVDVPILALADDTTELFVDQYFGWGIDDLVAADSPSALVERLRALKEAPNAAIPPLRGVALIAEKEARRVPHLRRALTKSGFDVQVAGEADELLRKIKTTNPVVVIAASTVGDLVELIPLSRRMEELPAWVITAPRRELDATWEALAGLERVAVVNNQGPPDAVLFETNAVLADSAPASIRSDRALITSAVAYRAAGGDTDDLGFTYNVSRSGLFIRTLAPPQDDEVWLELRPPRDRSRVRLMGTIAWRNTLSSAASATAPLGFGVRITGGLGDAIERWQDAVTRLANPRFAEIGRAHV